MASSPARRSGVRRSSLSGMVLGSAVGALLGACGVLPEGEEVDGPPSRAIDPSSVSDAVPRAEPKSKYGNPPSYVVNGKRYYTLRDSRGFVERGIASWYGSKFHGRRTSSGETYNMYAMTAAHKSLPLPTYVRVIDLESSRAIVVRVNDRGPFHDNRVIDLSYAAAAKLGILPAGTGFVEVRAVDASRLGEDAAEAETAGPVAETAGPVPIDVARRLYLQVGAFSLRANAERLTARLKGVADAGVRITPVVLNGSTVYRVRLGPLLSVAQADRLAILLARSGFESPHIVVD